MQSSKCKNPILIGLLGNVCLREERKRRSDLLNLISSCPEDETQDDLEKQNLKEEFKKSEKREEEFRRKLLSLQSETLPDGDDVAMIGLTQHLI